MPTLFFSKGQKSTEELSRKLKNGQITRIHKGIYTDAKTNELEEVILKGWADIVNYILPSAHASHRTAQELTPKNGIVVVSSDVKRSRKIHIANTLTIDVQSGSIDELTEPFLPNLKRSSPPRLYLENLMHSRGEHRKSLGRGWVEERLSTTLRKSNGENELNQIRDDARSFAEQHNLEDEFKQLNEVISALLSTHPVEGTLSNSVAIATAKREPYDVLRVERFKDLANYLNRCNLPSAPYQYSKMGWKTLSFFESYFSNFIEGTEFEIDEAEEIIFQNKTIGNRHKDSHDVSAVFEQVADYQSMSVFPETADEFIKELQSRHFDMMLERPDKNPGTFKTRVNKAGTSTFVLPDDVVGTLTKGFEIYSEVKQGLESAIFMQFLVSECHPFDDGNGRLSRIMMNSVLHSNDLHKIIVPTVHRDSYLNGLRKVTREGNFKTLVKVFYQLQQYSATIDWSDYGEARDALEEHCANLLPDEGTPMFNKVIRQFKHQLPTQI
ncbi:Fic family protein [Vibrio crassostreae]|uniref:Fic family protein n=1 Tax=Vibrio crassostreae TaxID=246167 RepID=UPI001B30274C|nr:Fic family protein [Vibrio crassostreae]